MSDQLRFADVFDEIASSDGLRTATAQRVFDTILRGDWTPIQVAGFLSALRLSGESAPVIAAAAKSMRQAMVPVQHGLPRVLDTCGTGGDGMGTLNVSTGAAIVCAAAGVPVAKHGNRAVSSRAGSADVLESLGIPIDLPTNAAAPILEECNIAFLMAPAHHPAMRHAVQARRELGMRTIFNCLGPLANPAGATHQLLGAFDDSLRRVLATTLDALGTRAAWVVRSVDGLDEVSPFGPTRVTQLRDGELTELEVTPGDFGLDESPPNALRGGSAAENAVALEAIVRGELHPGTDAIVLNAAAALVVTDELEPKEAAQKARETIESGKARATLETWRRRAMKARAG